MHLSQQAANRSEEDPAAKTYQPTTGMFNTNYSDVQYQLLGCSIPTTGMFNTNYWNVQYQLLGCSIPTTGMFNTNHRDVQYQLTNQPLGCSMIKTQYPTTGLTFSTDYLLTTSIKSPPCSQAHQSGSGVASEGYSFRKPLDGQDITLGT